MGADLFSSAKIRIERFSWDVKGPVPGNITLKAYDSKHLISLDIMRHRLGTYTRQADQQEQFEQ